MKPRPRLRKTIKWGGAAVTVLLVAAWVASGWVSLRVSDGGQTDYTMSGGRISIQYWRGDAYTNTFIAHTSSIHVSVVPHPAWKMDLHPWLMSWWVHEERGVFWGVLSIPLWMLVCGACTIWFAGWRLDTRARRHERTHLCAKCGYDRTGLLAGAVCPECGAGRAGSGTLL